MPAKPVEFGTMRHNHGGGFRADLRTKDDYIRHLKATHGFEVETPTKWTMADLKFGHGEDHKRWRAMETE